MKLSELVPGMAFMPAKVGEKFWVYVGQFPHPLAPDHTLVVFGRTDGTYVVQSSPSNAELPHRPIQRSFGSHRQTLAVVLDYIPERGEK